MKLLALAISLFSCLLYSTQPGRYRASAQGQVNKLISDASDDTESGKRIRECEQPDRVKPNVETKHVSQLCGKAITLPKPPYPAQAKTKRVSGTVVVDI